MAKDLKCPNNKNNWKHLISAFLVHQLYFNILFIVIFGIQGILTGSSLRDSF
jgi:hypothetical protein